MFSSVSFYITLAKILGGYIEAREALIYLPVRNIIRSKQ